MKPGCAARAPDFVHGHLVDRLPRRRARVDPRERGRERDPVARVRFVHARQLGLVLNRFKRGDRGRLLDQGLGGRGSARALCRRAPPFFAARRPRLARGHGEGVRHLGGVGPEAHARGGGGGDVGRDPAVRRGGYPRHGPRGRGLGSQPRRVHVQGGGVGGDHGVGAEDGVELDVAAAQVEQPRHLVQRGRHDAARARGHGGGAQAGQLVGDGLPGPRQRMDAHGRGRRRRPRRAPHGVDQVAVSHEGDERGAGVGQGGRERRRGRRGVAPRVDPDPPPRAHRARQPVARLRDAGGAGPHEGPPGAELGLGLQKVAAVGPEQGVVRGDHRGARRPRERGEELAARVARGGVLGLGRGEEGGVGARVARSRFLPPTPPCPSPSLLPVPCAGLPSARCRRPRPRRRRRLPSRPAAQPGAGRGAPPRGQRLPWGCP